MYAVIRTGGKQYRVAPGDVIRVEKLAPAGNDQVNFNVLAVSSAEGKVSGAGNASVLGRVLGEGRGDKVLVFHYKRKKQYKKLQGHRQPFTAVQITEISVDGESFKAPEGSLKNFSLPKGAASKAAEPKRKAASKKAASAAEEQPKSAAKKSAKPAAKAKKK